MKNILLRLSYDGSNYHGWQSQKDVPSVCDTIKAALEKICGHDISLIGCGRTDAGVHAAVYAANFKTTSTIPVDKIPHAVNALLPRDIALDYAEEVDGAFNAIGSCTAKRYTYRILNSRFRQPLLHNRALWYKHDICDDLLHEAAAHIIGEHDFQSFCGALGVTKTTVRHISDIAITRSGALLDISVTANGFLYNMMRNIVGTLLYVNEGKIAAEAIPQLLAARNRTLAGPTAPPQGLYMTGVHYDGISWDAAL